MFKNFIISILNYLNNKQLLLFFQAPRSQQATPLLNTNTLFGNSSFYRDSKKFTFLKRGEYSLLMYDQDGFVIVVSWVD